MVYFTPARKSPDLLEVRRKYGLKLFIAVNRNPIISLVHCYTLFAPEITPYFFALGYYGRVVQ
jgi:hypothetical protein